MTEVTDYLDSLRQLHSDSVDFAGYFDNHEDLSGKIKFAAEFTGDLQAYFKPNKATPGVALPWQKAPGFRLRPGEVTIWAGVNGTGKSLVTGQVVGLGALHAGEKVFIASLEMPPVTTLARMLRQASAGRNPSDQYIHDFLDANFNSLLVLDHRGVVKPKQMLGILWYIHERLGGVNHVIVDSLMKCGLGVDDYNSQKWFVNELCSFAGQTKTHVHLVAHARKGESSKAKLDKFDIKGASEISDQVDNVVLVWRNKDKEDKVRRGEESDDPDCILTVDKQRHGEWEGKIALWFHADSMNYLESPKAFPRSMEVER